MLSQSTNEECPELSPAHLHKVRAEAHVGAITEGRGARLSAQDNVLSLSAGERLAVLFALAHNPSVLPRLSEEPFKNVSPITTMLIIPIREAPQLSGMAQRTREGVIACVFRVRLL